MGIVEGAIEADRMIKALLQRALELAAIRLGILADRMEGCNDVARQENRPPTHELLSEARAFETEAREAAGMPPR